MVFNPVTGGSTENNYHRSGGWFWNVHNDCQMWTMDNGPDAGQDDAGTGGDQLTTTRPEPVNGTLVVFTSMMERQPMVRLHGSTHEYPKRNRCAC